MKTQISILSVLFTLITLFSCKDTPKNEQIITNDVEFKKEGELSLYSVNDSISTLITSLDIEIADNDYERETGLMYRKSMTENRGMLFIQETLSPQSFYMKNTLIPLDIIFVDDKFKVVSIQKNAKPLDETSLRSNGAAKYILEVNAGLSDRWNLNAGDSIAYKKVQ